ncbi:hypothetical protein LUZ62_047340 [Rhynchospora pubera]|uniref:Capsular polysaccharide assembling protein CapF C-terminal domain-containing protein n=1 Tax=Rhynchospora pubera TaxID=906938 RepID=A0AAV8FSZ8_9POAL|nr:hypothetical protein LUZ62_047340 [Rhynchospora pubera]
MANPRRSALQTTTTNPTLLPSFSDASPPPPSSVSRSLSSFAHFLKKPTAFPFLLFVFVLLTWLSLRFHHPTSLASDPGGSVSGSNSDADANLVRFSAAVLPSLIAKDKRGWLVDPIAAAREAGLNGGALDCSSLHVGQINPGALRGNHRHHTCNETFLIWGAETKFRLENLNIKDKGYAEVIIGADEVAIVTSPSGTAHALVNIDQVRFTSFLGCQDTKISPNSSNTDFKVWKDL